MSPGLRGPRSQVKRDASQGSEDRERLGSRFNRFWSAYCLSNFADGLLMTGLPLVAATMTSDPLQISGLLVARFLPWLVFGVASGVLVDRVDRRKAIIAANSVRAVALALAAVAVATGHGGVWALYAAVFAVVSCETVYDSASKAMVPTLVPRHLLNRANSRLEGGRVVTEDFAGAPAAGVLILVATAVPLVANAGAYLLAALVLLLLLRDPTRVPETVSTDQRRPTFREDMSTGLRFLWSDRVQRNNVLYNIATMSALPMATSVLVLVVQQVLGVPTALYGLFMAASAAGALLSSALVSALVVRLGRTPVFVLSMAALGVSLAGLGLTSNPYVAAGAWALFGASLAASNIVREALFQSITPNGLLGRATSTRRMFSWGVAPLGALAGGALGRIDLQLPLLVSAGILLLALTAYVPTFVRAVARADDMDRAAPAPAGKAPSGDGESPEDAHDRGGR